MGYENREGCADGVRDPSTQHGHQRLDRLFSDLEVEAVRAVLGKAVDLKIQVLHPREGRERSPPELEVVAGAAIEGVLPAICVALGGPVDCGAARAIDDPA